MLVKGSFEDIIYIVIGIVWIAYSIYKGTQKAKSKKTKPVDEGVPEKKTKSVFESFFDDILVENKQQPYAEEAEEFPVKEEPLIVQDTSEEVFSYDDYYEESNQQNRIDVYEDKVETQADLKREIQVKPINKKKKPRIDLRKAVVYSEILNRRYF